jgi:amidase
MEPKPLHSRRAFLEQGALLAAAALPSVGHIASAPSPSDPQSTSLREMSIAQLQEGMHTGTLTSHGITRAYLQRIAALDRKGPTIRAILETNPDALRIAEHLDAERRAGHVRGPLHGIPVIVKDNIDTHDRMQTTAGSLALEGNVAERDAFLIGQLRDAGCVLLAKANLSEWANFRSTRSSSGWSGRGRQCRNPYVLDRSPSGSSAGSAAAVAANLCAAAVGTETDGSIISPANVNGIVGIKPTVGLVSRAGIIPIAHSQDTAGPMGRTVADVAALLTAMAGIDLSDPATAATASLPSLNYTAALDADGLRGARIGIPYRRTGASPIVDGVVEAAIRTIRERGAEVVDPAEIQTLGQLGDNELDVMQYEFKADLNAYLATMPTTVPYRTLGQLIAFNEAHRELEMPYFGQELFLASEARGPLTDQAYIDARATCLELSRTRGLDATMDKYGLDALMGPSGGPAGLVDLATLARGGGPGSSQFPAVSGYPHITVPAGFHLGLPVGISFYGRAWSESVLIRLAYAFEQATTIRRPPTFIPTLALS